MFEFNKLYSFKTINIIIWLFAMFAGMQLAHGHYGRIMRYN